MTISNYICLGFALIFCMLFGQAPKEDKRVLIFCIIGIIAGLVGALW